MERAGAGAGVRLRRRPAAEARGSARARRGDGGARRGTVRAQPAGGHGAPGRSPRPGARARSLGRAAAVAGRVGERPAPRRPRAVRGDRRAGAALLAPRRRGRDPAPDGGPPPRRAGRRRPRPVDPSARGPPGPVHGRRRGAARRAGRPGQAGALPRRERLGSHLPRAHRLRRHRPRPHRRRRDRRAGRGAPLLEGTPRQAARAGRLPAHGRLQGRRRAAHPRRALAGDDGDLRRAPRRRLRAPGGRDRQGAQGRRGHGEGLDRPGDLHRRPGPRGQARRRGGGLGGLA